MTKKCSHVYCAITGHSNGPACPDCRELMDSVLVEEDKFGLTRGMRGHYCFSCWANASSGAKATGRE